MINDHYQEISQDDTELDIRQLLGEPTFVDDTVIPEGSGFGLQESMKYKLNPGDPVKHLVYESEKTKYNFILAVVDGEWRVSMKFKYPSCVDEK